MSTPNNPPNGKDPRSIDERIDALLMAVELNHADHEARIAKLEQISRDLKAMLEKVVNIQESLAGIALDHDARIKRIEGQQ